jgi:hypothetical protein
MMRRTFFTLLFAVSLALTSRGYTPPAGVPDPGTTWGTLHPIDTPNPTASTYAPGWFQSTPRANSIANGDAHDCYYVDNGAAGATDTSNTYGYPGHPRLTVPNIVYSPGAYVEIHGDGATGSHKYTTSMNPRGAGTAGSPIWFVGVNKPLFTAKLDFGAASSAHNSYMIFDGLYYLGARFDIRPRFAGNQFDHLCFRNCNLNGNSLAAIGSGISVGADTISDTTRTTQDIVVYNCEIYNYGDKNNPNEECGFYPLFFVTRCWVLDNNIHDVAEDGCGGSHSGQRTSSYYYIGRNQIHDDLTNGVDIKQYGAGVVISENTIWGHHDVWVNGVHKSSGTGESLVLHYSGNSTGSGSWKDYPEDISVLFNTIYDSRYGISTSQVGRLRVIGNVIYEQHTEPTDYTDIPYAISLRGIRGDFWVENNTIYSSDGGISVGDDPAAYSSTTTYYRGYTVSYSGASYVCIDDKSDAGIVGIAPSDSTHWKTFRVQIWGNVISNRNMQAQGDLTYVGSAFANNSTDEDYNLFYNSAWGEKIIYGGSDAHTLAWIKANTTKEAHGINGNPSLSGIKGIGDTVDVQNDFVLQSDSPAIDASTEGKAPSGYADFLSTFGLDIKRDRRGNLRPMGDGWDMGANEFDGSGNSQAPAPPGGLIVLPP